MLHGGCAKFQMEIFMGYDFIAYVNPTFFKGEMHPSHPPGSTPMVTAQNAQNTSVPVLMIE